MPTHTTCHLLLVALFAVWCTYGSIAYAATAVQSGDWSAAATWGGAVPSGIEENIVSPGGIDVLLDVIEDNC